MVGLGQPGDHPAAVAKATRCPAWHARMPSPIDGWILPVPPVIRGLILNYDVRAARDVVVIDAWLKVGSGVRGGGAASAWENRARDRDPKGRCRVGGLARSVPAFDSGVGPFREPR